MVLLSSTSIVYDEPIPHGAYPRYLVPTMLDNLKYIEHVQSITNNYLASVNVTRVITSKSPNTEP
jgi:hypothetical protein